MTKTVSVAERLAQSIHAAVVEPVRDEAVLHAAERILLDTLACAMAGVNAAPVRAVRQWARMIGGQPHARILGTAETSSVLGAALCNSTMLRHVDMNDCDWARDPAHPSDNIGGCLAVGEVTDASPLQVLTAILVAYEVQMRTTEFTKVSFFKKTGWDHTTFVTLASAVSAGVQLRLNPARLAHAIAIAGSYPVPGQVRVGQISMMKAASAGLAVSRGIEAAYLAANGVTGPLDVFEGKRGLSKLVFGECDWDVLAGPVEAWRLPRTCLKQYPAAYVIHSSIDAALGLRRENGFRPEDIEAVEVAAFGWLLEDMVHGMGGTSRYEIDARETADHSLPYCVGVSLLDGDYHLGQLDARRWEAPDLKAMLAKVVCVHDPSMDGGFPANRPTRVTVRLRNGATVSKHVPFPKGDPRNPLTDADIADKFHRLAGDRLSPAVRKRVIATALDFRNSSLADLMAACTTV
ncbi:MAG: MmgE/PrpD family protein [Acetobacteraceae bacterium]